MIGTQSDILARLKALLPRDWFRDATPILDGVLSGIAWALAAAYRLAEYARLQTRIATATEGFLDLISYDFFGTSLPRKAGESDESFRTRIRAMLLLEKGTRAGMIKALTLLTGRTPAIFEPQRAGDTLAYNSTAFYNYAGAYGAALHHQFFITAYRPFVQNPGYITYYGTGYYNRVAPYINVGLLAGSVTDQDIIDTVNAVKPEGTAAWVRILN